ncbi:MAG: hypothetical protein JNL43_15780 [Flavobacteriales bacterium]|nr:hypothetical protein [Flavobacteriales bacterium]
MKTFVHPLLVVTVLFSNILSAQNVGINSTGAAPDGSAMLDIVATDKGVLVPRVALTATNAIAPVAAPIASLLVYNTATAGVAPNNVTPGYYYWTGTVWTRLFSGGDGWLTVGNGGTVAGTNFIGTTDAVDWVIKTGGIAAANERARFMSTGQLVVNNVGRGLNTNDVFSTYADGTTNGTTANTSTLGLRAVNGYASGTGVGVFGTNSGTAANSFGIFGTAPATTGSANAIRGESAAPNSVAITGIANTSAAGVPTTTLLRGVIGQVNGTLVGTAVAIGVQGGVNATMTVGDARGVNGSSPADDGTGVFGSSTTAAATAGALPVGVWGQAASSIGTGVIGLATSAAVTANPTGVLGLAQSNSGFAVNGANLAASGTGVLGEGNNLVGNFLVNGGGGAFTGATNGSFSYATTVASGTGVIGVGNNNALIGTLAAGSGGAFTGTGTGAYGIATTVASGTGVVGVGNNAGANTLVNGSGVAGSGVNFGVYGFASSNANGAAGAPVRAGGYFTSGVGVGNQSFAYVGCMEGAGVPRKIMGNGTLNTMVKDLDGQYALLSAPEAPENLFQDYGTGQLVNGRAHVAMDPIFAKNILVNEAHPLRAFVQLRGDCKGVYVTNETADGFDVVELQGGTSDVRFTWSVVANRANVVHPDGTVWKFAEERFTRTHGPQETVAVEKLEQQPAKNQRNPATIKPRTEVPATFSSTDKP